MPALIQGGLGEVWRLAPQSSLLIKELNYSDFDVLWDIEGKVYTRNHEKEDAKRIRQHIIALPISVSILCRLCVVH